MRPLYTKSVDISIPAIATWPKCVRLRLSAIINARSTTLRPPTDTHSPALSTKHTYQLDYKTLDPGPYHHLQSP